MNFSSPPTPISRLPEPRQEFLCSLRAWVFPLSLGSDRVVIPTPAALPASLPLQRCHSISRILKDDAPTSYFGCSPLFFSEDLEHLLWRISHEKCWFSLFSRWQPGKCIMLCIHWEIAQLAWWNFGLWSPLNQAGFRSHLCHWPVLWFGAGYFTPWSLSFLTYSMRIVIVSTRGRRCSAKSFLPLSLAKRTRFCSGFEY